MTWSNERNFGINSDDTRAAALDESETAKGEEVYKHCEGVLYLPNTIRFHGTRLNVISFTPHRKVWASVRFSRTSQSWRWVRQLQALGRFVPGQTRLDTHWMKAYKSVQMELGRLRLTVNGEWDRLDKCNCRGLLKVPVEQSSGET